MVNWSKLIFFGFLMGFSWLIFIIAMIMIEG